MGLFLFFAFLVVPIVELYIFAQVANAFGFGTTILWIIAVSIIGAWLVKREGLSAWRRASRRLAAGEAPTDELLTGVLILFGGALMLTPGFLTDAFGLSLLFPPTRALYRAFLRGRMRTGATVITGGRGFSGFGGFAGGASPGSGSPSDGVWDVDSWEDDQRPPGQRELPTDPPDPPAR